MTPQTFNSLDIDSRANIVWEHGEVVDERAKYKEYTCLMYHLYNFYVEVFYDAKDNAIKSVQALETQEDWQSYMDSINLQHLMGNE